MALQKKTTIPQVAEDEFWQAADILNFERIRVELRDLVKFLDRGGHKVVYTDLEDQENSRTEWKEFDMSGDLEDYRQG